MIMLCSVYFEWREEGRFIIFQANCKGLTVYEEIKNYFELKSIPIENVVAIATDGAPSMIGKSSGVVYRLKKR